MNEISERPEKFCIRGLIWIERFKYIYEENACRTQLRVEIAEKDSLELKNYPLGNHHLVLPGDRLKQFKILSRFL